MLLLTTQNSRQNFLKICLPQQQKEVEQKGVEQKGVEKAMLCFIEIQSENMKMNWSIRLFIFCMICSFSKCDGFTVL